MVFLFRERAGRTFVDNGEYTLDTQNGAITASEWRNSAQAGVTLFMAAILRIQEPSAGRCPRCDTVNDTEKAMQGAITWFVPLLRTFYL